MRKINEAFMSSVAFPPDARVLEIGCGSGPVAAMLVQWPDVAEVVGVDPSPVMLAKARELRGHIQHLSFHEGDGRALLIEDTSFDTVVLHSTLTHVPGPERVLSEAFRVLRPGGKLAICDGDYKSITISNHPHDPLSKCIESFQDSFINDLYLVPKLTSLVKAAGFHPVRFDSYSYLETAGEGSELENPALSHLLTIVARGADALVAAGSIGEELAGALKAEARRRFDAGEFIGQIVYASLIAQKPV
jgi:ubiquinone/menaquinone biosynthesis C-methylase UbiE